MRRYLVLLHVLLAALMGCNSVYQERQAKIQTWMTEKGKIKVLSTVAMVASLVDEIGGERVDSLTLIEGELDPHSYQLVKGDDEKLSHADMIFANGLGLEHGPSLRAYLEKEPKVVALGNALKKDEPNHILSMHGQEDPHIWMDISIWASLVPYIVEAFQKHDPSHAEEYMQRGEALQKKLQTAHQQVRQIVHTIPKEKRYFITSHDAFHYFTRAYLAEPEELVQGTWRDRFAAPEGLSPESQLSLMHIQEIVNFVKAHSVRFIFPESNVSRDSLYKIIEAVRAEGHDVEMICCPLYGDAMGPPGTEGETYEGMLLHNAKMLASYLTTGKPPQ